MATPGRSGSSPSATVTRSPSVELTPAPPADWPRQATDSIVKLVDTVRDKTTGPALSVVRYLVYGTVIALLAIPLSVLLLIGLMRVLEHGLLKLGLTDPMWIVYLLFGAIFTAAGLFAWHKAKQTPSY